MLLCSPGYRLSGRRGLGVDKHYSNKVFGDFCLKSLDRISEELRKRRGEWSYIFGNERSAGYEEETIKPKESTK